MSRRRKLLQLCAASLLLPFGAAAQSPRRIAKVGFLSASSAEANAERLRVFHEAMRELGWAQGRDYRFEARFGDGTSEALSRAAAELVAAKPDVLIGAGDAAIRPLADRTRRIPIVFPASRDPVGNGFAASLQRPGKNLTGLTTNSHELASKRLQILKEAFPDNGHVLALYNSAEPQTGVQLERYEDAAKQLRLRFTTLELRSAAEMDEAFRRLAKAGPDCVVVLSAAVYNAQRAELGRRFLNLKLPVLVEQAGIAEAGALIAYTPPPLWAYRRMASYVDRILKGANPAELPIEQPSQLELVINTRSARAMGLKLPQSLLVRADRLIE